MKGSTGWNLSIIGVDQDPLEFYLMFLPQELMSNCVKFILKSVFIDFCIKIVL